VKSKKRKKLVAMSVFFTFVLSHLSFLFFLCVCVCLVISLCLQVSYMWRSVSVTREMTNVTVTPTLCTFSLVINQEKNLRLHMNHSHSIRLFVSVEPDMYYNHQ
jgi:D-alanyl-lipoteichoic acid acyltransferase DltB (MBOAT superfamily)